MLLGKHLHNCNCARNGIEGNRRGEGMQVGKEKSRLTRQIIELQPKMQRTTVHLDLGCIIGDAQLAQSFSMRP